MTMADTPVTEGVLLLGSFPCDTSQEVFRKVCEALPGRLRSVPDGETGERFNFFAWQASRFPTETIWPWVGGTELPESIPKYGLEAVKPTDYDTAAIKSYKEFVQLRKEGVIPSNMRFQVCLPTPYNVVTGHCKAQVHRQMDPLYTKRLTESIDRIVEQIPHHDLIIQLDMPFEVAALEYEHGRLKFDTFKAHFTPVMSGIIDRVTGLCQHIPRDVGLAFHLCYGDYQHKHIIEPVDMGVMVELANEIINTAGAKHSIEWFHMPVPRDRTDQAYFEPLKKLKLGSSRLYLGLVHPNDEEGTKQRIKTAQLCFSQPFGVATECGMGRTPREEIDSILAISKAVSVPLK